MEDFVGFFYFEIQNFKIIRKREMLEVWMMVDVIYQKILVGKYVCEFYFCSFVFFFVQQQFF